MLIGVPKECKDGEFRVGMTPEGVAALVKRGHEVHVERNAGKRIGFRDADYQAAGATIVEGAINIYCAALIVKVKELQPEEFRYLQSGQIIFAYLHLAPDPELAKAMLSANVIGIAYETVSDAYGTLPLLAPMSMIAGRLAISVGAWGLQLNNGGKGTILSGGADLPSGRVLVMGAGTAGRHATDVAVGLSAKVTVLDINVEKLARLKKIHGDKIKVADATPENIAHEITQTDLIIGAILNHGNLAPKIITRAMLRKSELGTVLVDICIDQAGLSETSRPSSHSAPFYVEEGVVHYCVGNMPSAVARSATLALSQATLPYVYKLADKGLAKLCSDDSGFARGVQIYRGHVCHPDIARDLTMKYSPLDSLLSLSNPC